VGLGANDESLQVSSSRPRAHASVIVNICRLWINRSAHVTVMNDGYGQIDCIPHVTDNIDVARLRGTLELFVVTRVR